MIKKYITIEKQTQAEIVEKKSQFIANVIPVDSKEEAEEKLEWISKENRNAKHNVYAYRLVNNGEERFSDNGEPSGTAGIPILDILRGSNLQNVLVVVTRYFGGILLGTGGLVRAYSDVTKMAIEKSKRVIKNLSIQYELRLDYNYHDKINYYCLNNGFKINNVDFSNDILMQVTVSDEQKDKFIKDIEELTNRSANIIVKKEGFYI